MNSIKFLLHYGTTHNQNILIVGDGNFLGEWNLNNALHLGYLKDGFWSLELMLPVGQLSLEYKYVLVDDHNKNVFWEAGSNHKIESLELMNQNKSIEVRDTFQVLLFFKKKLD